MGGGGGCEGGGRAGGGGGGCAGSGGADGELSWQKQVVPVHNVESDVRRSSAVQLYDHCHSVGLIFSTMQSPVPCASDRPRRCSCPSHPAVSSWPLPAAGS